MRFLHPVFSKHTLASQQCRPHLVRTKCFGYGDQRNGCRLSFRSLRGFSELGLHPAKPVFQSGVQLPMSMFDCVAQVTFNGRAGYSRPQNNEANKCRNSVLIHMSYLVH